jgi:exosortase
VSTSAVAVTPAATTSRSERSLNASLILLGIGLGALWLVCCRHLSAEWSYNEQYNYGWFVPFFALYLFWLRWDDRPEIGHQKSAVSGQRSGNLFIAAALLFLILPIRLIEIANPDWRPLSWAHALVVVSLTLLLVAWIGGKPWLRHFAFPVLFFLVSVPWPSGIEQPIIQGLMPTVANIATGVLSLFGIPADVQGNLIHINGGVVGVNEACSGVRSLQTSLMIGLLFGELNRLRLGRRLALIVAAISIAFIANCGRAFFLVWIAANRGVGQVEHWHDAAGYAIVGLVFFGCLGLTKLLSRRQRDATTGKTAEHSEIPARSATHSVAGGRNPPVTRVKERPGFPSAISPAALAGVLTWLLLVEIGVDAWYRTHERNLEPSVRWSVKWPEGAPQFRDIRIDERTRSILHEDEGRGAMWATPEGNLTDGPRIASTSLLYFFRWYPGHNSALLANAHRPDVCLPATGWRQTGDFQVHEYAASPTLTIPFRHFEFENEVNGRPRYAHAFYCVWEDRVRKGSSTEDVKAGMAATPSAWTRSERIQAVLEGRRHLGQQVMEYLLIPPGELSAAEAEEAFAGKLPDLITSPTR